VGSKVVISAAYMYGQAYGSFDKEENYSVSLNFRFQVLSFKFYSLLKVGNHVIDKP
jgi:hypothetical protein